MSEPESKGTCEDCGGKLVGDTTPVLAVHRYGRELKSSVILRCVRCGAHYIEIEGSPVDLIDKVTAIVTVPPQPELSGQALIGRAMREHPELFSTVATT